MLIPTHYFRDIERKPEYLGPEKCAPLPFPGPAGTMWFIPDGCGIACAIVTWFLVLYAESVILFVKLIPSRDYAYSIINGIVFNLLALALASHCPALLTDPGAVPKGNAAKELTESLQCSLGRRCTSVPSAAASGPAVSVSGAFTRRTTTVLGSTAVWARTTASACPVHDVRSPHFLARAQHGGFPCLHCLEEDWTKCSSSPPTTVALLVLLVLRPRSSSFSHQ